MANAIAQSFLHGQTVAIFYYKIKFQVYKTLTFVLQ